MTTALVEYAKAMRAGDSSRCAAIEKNNGLYGYPPEIVCVGLRAADEGRDVDEAIRAYLDGDDEEDHSA